MITPEEIVDPNVDEHSVMTYLSQFPKAKLKPGAPLRPKLNPKKARAYGPGEGTGLAGMLPYADVLPKGQCSLCTWALWWLVHQMLPATQVRQEGFRARPDWVSSKSALISSSGCAVLWDALGWEDMVGLLSRDGQGAGHGG